jgi:uncharacterized membrane protein
MHQVLHALGYPCALIAFLAFILASASGWSMLLSEDFDKVARELRPQNLIAVRTMFGFGFAAAVLFIL